MKIIKPSVEFLSMTPYPLQLIEKCGRICYKSEDKISYDSSKKFVNTLLRSGHESVIEHSSMSYRIICDRGVTHELVRHRLFSYSQESTRYVNYKEGIEVIEPIGVSGDVLMHWETAMRKCEIEYRHMIESGAKPQMARSVLPNSLKTEIAVTGNLREWRHFFKMRTDKKAHPQMMEIANMILRDASNRIPIVFDSFLRG